MPVLNTSTNLFFGSLPVEKVMNKGAQVWGRQVPVNTSLPIVSGAVFVGDTATTTNGTWDFNPSSYEYKRQIDDDGWEDVSGEVTSTFADISEIGEYRSAVRAQNAHGWSDWVYSSSFVITEAVSGITLDGPATANALLTLGNARIQHAGTGGAHSNAWSNTELIGKLYMEVECVLGVEEAILVYSGDGTQEITESAVAGFVWDTPRVQIVPAQWSMSVRANYGMGTNEVSETVALFDSAQSVVRVRVCIDSSTRQFWVTAVGTPFDGNPAAGSGETFVLNGASALLTGANASTGDSVTFMTPDEHLESAPTGFTPI